MQTVRGWSRFLEERGEGLINRVGVVAWAAVVTLLVGACGSGETSPRREGATAAPTSQLSPSPRPTDVLPTEVEPAVGLPPEWIAVFRVGEAQDLNEEAQDLLRLVPKNVAVAPIGCWVGLPKQLGNPTGESVYVSAVVAETRQELNRVIGKAGREPILVGEFQAMCVD
jgi:hypothetical protein